MAREKTGWTGQDKKGRWYYRYQFTDANGKRRNVRRLATSESNAKAELRKALNKQEQQGERAIEGDRLRFTKLIEIYKKKKVFAAKYVGETKVGGLRSLAHVEMLIKTLCNHFENKLVKSITHSDIEQFKLKRLNTLKSNKEQRAIASVNRELECLRSVMNFAKREGYILFSPFERGSTLISKSDENRRQRILSYDEEKRLLAACDVTTAKYERNGEKIEAKISPKAIERKQILKVIIIMAVDTAMRRGEIFKTTWRDVDFTNHTITIKAVNSKTARERIVGITPRLFDALLNLWNQSPKMLGLTLFGLDKPNSTIKKSWATVCDLAKLNDFHFHDLRHTAITRLVETGTPSATIMKISGHSQQTTFARYVNPNTESVKSAAISLHNFNSQNSYE
ncbi:MAG TPA: site-specific integrase [Pyrinomonadaceae bacterium]|jgi:integrase